MESRPARCLLVGLSPSGCQPADRHKPSAQNQALCMRSFPLVTPRRLAANKERQCNRVQSGDGKKTKACQCEHLRHGSPSLNASDRGAVTQLSFFE